MSRTRHVQQSGIPEAAKSASLDELVAQIDNEANAVKTVNATVMIAATTPVKKKGKTTGDEKDWQEIPGYILIKKPSDMRMIGLVPVVRTRLFDMVSDGKQFKLSIPPKNKFYVGSADVVTPSENQMENIRPQAILDALLMRPVSEGEIPVLRVGTEDFVDLHDKERKKHVQLPTYVVAVIKKGAKDWYLDRRIVFSRVDLKAHQQEIYDTMGNLVTQATYENYTTQGGIDFPETIRIVRPKEGYEINLTIEKLKLNDPLTAEQFELKQPEGSQLQVLK